MLFVAIFIVVAARPKLIVVAVVVNRLNEVEPVRRLVVIVGLVRVLDQIGVTPAP